MTINDMSHHVVWPKVARTEDAYMDDSTAGGTPVFFTTDDLPLEVARIVNGEQKNRSRQDLCDS